MCRKLFFFVFVVLAMGLLGLGQDDAAGADPNLALWYKLDESGSTTAVPDSSSYNRDGTLYQWPEEWPDNPEWTGFTPGWVPDGGQFGGCLVFYDDSRITVPNTALSTVTNGITVSLWLKDAWRVGMNYVFDAGTSQDPSEEFRVMALIGTAPDAEVLWRAGNNSNDTLRWDLDGGSVGDLEGWHNWTFVKDEVAGNIRIYFDGSLAESNDVVDDTLSTVLPGKLAGGFFDFRIGSRNKQYNDLEGTLDEFLVYDRALSDDEVERLYYAGGYMDKGSAWKPSPAHRGQNLCPDVSLSWTEGDYAAQHEVFFGTDWDDVNDMTDPCATKNPGEESYDAGANETLNPGVTYYWRIDEVNGLSTWKGSVWQFTINDGNAFDPDPEDGETWVLKESLLSWSPGCWAASHKVYFSADLSDVESRDLDAYLGETGSTSIDPCAGDLEYLTDYYWVVDEVNGATTWSGQVWSFQTENAITDPNLLLWYRLDDPEQEYDSKGYEARDSSDYLRHSYLRQRDFLLDYSVPPWTPDEGRWGGSLGFYGDTVIWVPAATLNKLSDAISIIAWIQGGSSYAFQANGGDSQLAVNFDGSNVVWRAGNDTNDVLTMGGNPSGWNHYAFIKDETQGNIQIYFNGELAESNDVVDNTLIGVRGKPFKIGSRTQDPVDFSNARMDDFIIYDRALSGDEILRQYYVGGPVGKVELAWNANPQDMATEVAHDVVLTWKPGDYADSHDVFFGTNWDDVNDVNSSNYASYPNVDYNHTDACSYDPNGFLELGRLYYWRIDEVSDTCDASPWRGNIWRFTVAEYITVDDMEGYDNIWDGWYYGTDTWSNSELFNQASAPVRGNLTMKFTYDNTIPFDPFSGLWYFSEIESKNLEPNDWTEFDLKRLALWFYGESDNAITGIEPMFLAVEDYNNVYVEIRYGDGEDEDANDISIEEWQEWTILLSSLNDANLASLRALFIRFGEDRFYPFPGGYGFVYFDDIRLYPLVCVPERRKPAADLNNDCTVDFGDAEIMADEWLEADVNLGQVQAPKDANLVGWWEFDEGSGSTAPDSSSYNHHGTLEINDVNVCWVAGPNDVNYALEFSGGRVRVPDAQELRPLDQVSACAWIYYSEQQSSTRVVVKGADNKETFGLEVSGDDKLVFLVRDGSDPNADSYMKYAAESDNDTLDRDEWIHIAGTFDGNSLKCYVNGELQGTNNDANAIVFLSQDTNDLAIGNMSDDDRAPFRGTIDDVRVYNYGLSQEEIGYIAADGEKIFTVQSVANLYNDEDLGKRAVNFRDFAVIADGWLEKKLWPE